MSLRWIEGGEITCGFGVPGENDNGRRGIDFCPKGGNM